MLADGCFGPFQFEVDLVRRESIFRSTMHINSETWLGLGIGELVLFEQTDEILLRKSWRWKQGCPKELLFLELGCIQCLPYSHRGQQER